jgi:hypothetical protein
VAAAALTQQMHRGHPPWPAPPIAPARQPGHTGMDGLERLARPHTQRDHPIDHHVAETAAVSRTEVRPGARATRTCRPLAHNRRRAMT